MPQMANRPPVSEYKLQNAHKFMGTGSRGSESPRFGVDSEDTISLSGPHDAVNDNWQRLASAPLNELSAEVGVHRASTGHTYWCAAPQNANRLAISRVRDAVS